MNYESVTLNKLKQAKHIFLTGGAGVGKTTLTCKLIEAYEEDAKKVAKLASTGMAATLIGGQTLHSFLDLGIASNLESLQNNGKLLLKKKIKKLISAMDLIVIDEISMVSAELFELIALRLNQAEYSGALLVVGDFLQLPPVVKCSECVAFAFESMAWQKLAFEIVTLQKIYRTDDKAFIELLHAVRFGLVDETVHNQLNNYIKPLPYDLSKFTFLFGKNNSASQHNREQLQHIDNELFIKEMQIVKHIKSVQEYEVKRFVEDARIEESLHLKVGVPVLFTRNSWNYFNGERGVVVNIDSTYIYVEKEDGYIVKLEQVAQEKTRWSEKIVKGKKELVQEVIFTLYQYPIKLAFAITIHKSQGMSIANLIIQTNEIFAPSQFYVALSRASNPQQLTLIAPNKQWYELAFVHLKAMAFVKGKCV